MTATLSVEKKASSAETEIAPRSVRLLLAVWDLGGNEVNQGKVTDRVKTKQEKSAVCQKFFDQLEKINAIEIAKKKVSITDKGIELLGQSLKSSDLAVTANTTGSWLVRALLKWIAHTEATVSQPATNGKVVGSAIDSYEAFKPEALSLFKKLDKGYNYAGLVPIWHMRRELGGRIGRLEFNDWVMQMQADQLFYLQSGEAIGATDDQKQDSISSEIRGLLFYVSQPS